MKKYPKYKNTGVSWLGEVPEHWDVKKLKYIVRLKNEKAAYDPSILRIENENIESWTGKYIKTETVFADRDELKAFKAGDVLFNKLRPYLAKAYLSNSEGYSGGELLVLRPTEEIESRFLFYRTLSHSFIHVVNGSTEGAKMPRADWEFISQLPIPYADFSDQQTIASFLDDKTKQIDTLIEKKQRLIELLKEERQAVINEAVTKGINPKAKMKPSGIEWLGDVSEHWEVKRLKFVFRLSRGVDLSNDKFIEGPYPVMGSNGSIGMHNEFTTKGPGITIGRSGSVGEINFVATDYWAHNTCLYVQENYGNDIRFIFYLLHSMDIKYLAGGSVVGSLDRNKIHDVFVPNPSYEEQKAIALFLDHKTVQIDDICKRTEKEIELLLEYRTALITEVVTGKVDVGV